MLKVKKFNYKEQVLDFGFLEYELTPSNITIEGILSKVSENLIVVDTNGTFLLSALKQMESLLNQSEKVVVGLTNDQTLSKLKAQGVRNGFYRSTDERFSVGIILVDKRVAFLAFDENHIYEVLPRYVQEIFDYVNHVIWSKANYENCQGTLRKVEEARFSVVMPAFLNDINPNDKKIKYFSESSGLNGECILLTEEKDINRQARVTPFTMKSFGFDDEELCVNVFDSNYYPIKINDDSLYTAKSFEKRTIQSLMNENIWFKGKRYKVEESQLIKKTLLVPLDKVKTYEPDFEKYADEKQGIVGELNVSIEIKPLKLDQAYTLSPRYKAIERVMNQLNEGLNKIKNLNPDEKILGQLEQIKTEHLLSEKLRMYNTLVSEIRIGDSTLTNKKPSVNPINVNEEELIVPSELIGKLYVKQNRNFLATTEQHLPDALKWLEENKYVAILIEA